MEASCEAKMPGAGKGNMYNVGDVRAVLERADVMAAFAAAPAVFASPEPPIVFRLKQADRALQLGGGPAGAGAAPVGFLTVSAASWPEWPLA